MKAFSNDLKCIIMLSLLFAVLCNKNHTYTEYIYIYIYIYYTGYIVIMLSYIIIKYYFSKLIWKNYPKYII